MSNILEARLIEEARDASKIKLENGTSPTLPSLTEAAQTNMEVFLEYTLMILPALRIDCFIRNTRSSSRDSDHAVMETDIPLFELHAKKNNIYAKSKAHERRICCAIGFTRTPRIGTTTKQRVHLTGSFIMSLLESEYSSKLKNQNQSPETCEGAFSRKIMLSVVPSAAASVVVGRIANGTTEWKVRGQKKTYKEWEREQITELEL